MSIAHGHAENHENDVLGIGGGRLPFELEHTIAVAPEGFEVRVRLGAGIDPYARAQNPLEESVLRRLRGRPIIRCNVGESYSPHCQV